MTPLQKILGSQNPEHQKFLCAACSSEFFWRSVYGGRQCWTCHPPPALSMVVASNLTAPGGEAAEEDEGWVECTDGQYRDYFVDAGRMWLVDEGPDFVRFTLVR